VRPNFLFIFCDQLRGDALGSLETLPPLRTPAMDDLAARGVRFASCYTPNPVCVPAREAVVTGRWAHRYGCMENGGPRASAAVPTFPRLLHEAGYVTFSAGKQHFHPVRDGRGYGRMMLSEGQPAYRQDDDYLLFLRDHGQGHVTMPGGRRGPYYYYPQESPVPDEMHMTPWTAARCVEFIRANRNRPFLCTAAFFKPHPPFDPPRRYWDRYPTEAVTLPEVPEEDRAPHGQLDIFLRTQNRSKSMDAPDEARMRAVRSAYYALVEQIDDAIASLVQTLRDCDVLENTIVVVSADHGELLGEHDAWGKRSFYEGSACVPLLMSWPAELPAGVVRGAPVTTIDLFPTFLDAAGVELPEGLDGVSLLPYARDGVPPERPGVAAEYGNERVFKLMWRWRETGANGIARDWKYVWLANGGREQLFDLTADPHEMANLAARDRDRCAAAHAQLVEWCRQTDFESALGPDGRLTQMPFEPTPLGEVKERVPAWVARDPDFVGAPGQTAVGAAGGGSSGGS
jgi:choline-sulfatase